MESIPFRSSRYAKANATGEAVICSLLNDQLGAGKIEDGPRPSGGENGRGANF